MAYFYPNLVCIQSKPDVLTHEGIHCNVPSSADMVQKILVNVRMVNASVCPEDGRSVDARPAIESPLRNSALTELSTSAIQRVAVRTLQATPDRTSQTFFVLDLVEWSSASPIAPAEARQANGARVN